MAVEYNWEWGPLLVSTVDQIENVIINIEWKCTAVDTLSGFQVMQNGNLMMPTPNLENFIKLEDINKSLIETWMNSYMDKQSIEDICLSYIQQQTAPAVMVVEIPD